MCNAVRHIHVQFFMCEHKFLFLWNKGIPFYSELAESSYRAWILNLSVALSISIEMIVRFFFFDHL